MLAHGNNDPLVCAANLLKMSEYDLHMMCDVGMNPYIIDSNNDIGDVKYEAMCKLREFEKRVNPKTLQAEREKNGGVHFWFGMSDQP